MENPAQSFEQIFVYNLQGVWGKVAPSVRFALVFGKTC